MYYIAHMKILMVNIKEKISKKLEPELHYPMNKHISKHTSGLTIPLLEETWSTINKELSFITTIKTSLEKKYENN